MDSACFGLVATAPGRPVQAMGDGVLAVGNDVEESADFGEGERDQASMSGCRSVRFGMIVGLVVVFI